MIIIIDNNNEHFFLNNSRWAELALTIWTKIHWICIYDIPANTNISISIVCLNIKILSLHSRLFIFKSYADIIHNGKNLI